MKLNLFMYKMYAQRLHDLRVKAGYDETTEESYLDNMAYLWEKLSLKDKEEATQFWHDINRK